MAVELSWEIPNHIVKARLYDEMDAEGIIEFVEGLTPYLRNDGVKIHVLLDDSDVKNVPFKIQEFSKALRTSQFFNKKNK